MGKYRERMERDLQIRGFSPCTQECYLGRMKAFVRYFMRPPDQLTLEDIHTYQLHLTRERQVSWECSTSPSRRVTISPTKSSAQAT